MGRRQYEGDEKQRRRVASLVSYHKHKDEISARRRGKHAEISEELNRRRRVQYARNPQLYRDESKAYYLRNKEWINKKRRARWKEQMKNADFREKERVRNKRRAEELRAKVYQKLGNKCMKCGFDNPKCFQIHHVVPIHGRKMGQPSFTQKELRQILKMTEQEVNSKYRLVCANCHILNFH